MCARVCVCVRVSEYAVAAAATKGKYSNPLFDPILNWNRKTKNYKPEKVAPTERKNVKRAALPHICMCVCTLTYAHSLYKLVFGFVLLESRCHVCVRSCVLRESFVITWYLCSLIVLWRPTLPEKVRTSRAEPVGQACCSISFFNIILLVIDYIRRKSLRSLGHSVNIALRCVASRCVALASQTSGPITVLALSSDTGITAFWT